MREIVYFSNKAVTTGNFKDLMKAGRMDIACHAVIHSFFVSNAKRDDVNVHLFFYGPPDPPKHLEITPDASISKKDVAGLIRRMLFKHVKNQKKEAMLGCFVEKKSLLKWVDEIGDRDIYVLDKSGEDIREIEIGENPIFILGDHEGMPKAEKRRILKSAKKVSLGKTTYFASQSLAILHNELDRRGL